MLMKKRELNSLVILTLGFNIIAFIGAIYLDSWQGYLLAIMPTFLFSWICILKLMYQIIDREAKSADEAQQTRYKY